MRAWRDRNSAPQWITSLMVVFDPSGVLWCFCFTVFSFSVARSRVRFTPSACHSCEKLIVKFFSFNERSCSVSKCGCSGPSCPRDVPGSFPVVPLVFPESSLLHDDYSSDRVFYD